MKREEKETQAQSTQVTKLILVLEIVYMILGLVLLLLPQIQLTHICYGLSGMLIVVGIILIVRYFVTEAYRNLNEYGFSIGVLLLILGICALVKISDVAFVFPTILGICMLFTAITKLQNALDLKAIENGTWLFFLSIAVFVAVCAIVILLNPFSTGARRDLFLHIVLIADGIIGILGMLYLSIHVHKYNKNLITPSAKQERTVAAEPDANGSADQKVGETKEDEAQIEQLIDELSEFEESFKKETGSIGDIDD